MNSSAAWSFRRLPNVGRLFVKAIGSLGLEEAQTVKRWANAWRLVLRGEDTAATRAALARDAARLRRYLERLPEAERYEAAMAIHTRVPRSVANDPLLSGLVKDLSILLEPGLEKQVSEAVRAIHREIGLIFGAANTGKTLTKVASGVLPHLQALKAMTGTSYAATIEEIVRETVRQLRSTPNGEIKRIGSKLNSVQGAVAQAAFFRATQFRRMIAMRLKQTRLLVRTILGTKWTTSVITEGRIFIATKTKGGYRIQEFVDGAIVVHEKAAAPGKLAQGFPRFTAQAKAEVDITALSQNLQDELRRTPNWGSEDAIMLIPSGSGYKALQVVPPPAGLDLERVLVAAEGGRWPKNLIAPPSVLETLMADAPLTRDACRKIAAFVLSKTRAALKASPTPSP